MPITETLNETQRGFCETYIIDLNISAASRRCGISEKQGQRYVNDDPACQAYITYLQAKRQERTQITADRVLKELAKIAFVDPRSIVSVDEGGSVVVTPSDMLTPEDAACVSEIAMTKDGIRVKTHDKIQALNLLGKHLKLFTDISETNISFNRMGNVVVSYAKTGENGQEIVEEKALTFNVGSEPNKLGSGNNQDVDE